MLFSRDGEAVNGAVGRVPKIEASAVSRHDARQWLLALAEPSLRWTEQSVLRIDGATSRKFKTCRLFGE